MRNRAGAIKLLALAGILASLGVSDTSAQWAAPGQSSPFPPPPGQAPGAANDPFPPPPGQSRPVSPARPGAPGAQANPFPAPGAAPGGGGNPCEVFLTIRADAEKAAGAIREAGERKATREEVCPLFQRFATAEGKMLKFLVDNQSKCGVPPNVVQQVKTQHARTQAMRTNVCKAGPSGPAGPTLSDALGGPVLPEPETKPGRGIFDTLTGSPLAR